MFNADGKDQAYTVTEEQLKELNDKGANFENVNEYEERKAKAAAELERLNAQYEAENEAQRKAKLEREKAKDLVTNPKKAETTTAK
jgi:hypothetical protein